MVDKSDWPCKICEHKQKQHWKHFAYCEACGIINYKPSNPSSTHCFERLENLKYLEWAYKQKESTDE